MFPCKHHTDFLPRCAVERNEAIDILRLLAAGPHKKCLRHCWLGMLDEPPRSFAELPAIYSEPHEFFPFKESLRIVRNSHKCREQRLVDSHLPEIFLDLEMDEHLCPQGNGGRERAPCRIEPHVMNAELDPGRNDPGDTPGQSKDAGRIAHGTGRVEFRLELLSGAF